MIRIEVQDQFGQWRRHMKTVIAVFCISSTLTACGRSEREVKMARECYEATLAVATARRAMSDYQGTHGVSVFQRAILWAQAACGDPPVPIEK